MPEIGVRYSPLLGLLKQFTVFKEPESFELNQCWLTLVQRRRQWANVKQSLIQRLVYAG